MKRALAGAAIVLACTATDAVADDEDYEVYLSKYISEHMKLALTAPEVVAAVQAQNAANANLTEAGIDALDRQWRAEAKTKGLNVAQTDPTSDYMQGDEDKWLKTYGVGVWRTFTDAPEEGAVQVSMTISDNEKAIGAMTVGINIAKLPRQ